MRFKAISFDFYGTLVDWLQIWIKVSDEIIKENNLQINSRNLALEWRSNQRKIFERGFIKYEDSILKSLEQLCSQYKIKNNNYEKRLFKNWKDIQVFSEVIKTLKVLKKKYKVAICTNSSLKLFNEYIKKIKIDFDAIIISDEVMSNKPNREIYEKMVESVNENKNDIIHIASSQMDIKGATNANLAVCWVNRLKENLNQNVPQPTFEVKNLAEIKPLIKKLN